MHNLGVAPVPALERILRKVRYDHGCWTFTGALTDGYGVVGRGARGTGLVRAHREVYAKLVGPIPAGLDLDHLCRNRACCNPLHLEPVTRQTNARRGAGLSKACPRGHVYGPRDYDSTGWRRCKACRRLYDASRNRP